MVVSIIYRVYENSSEVGFLVLIFILLLLMYNILLKIVCVSNKYL